MSEIRLQKATVRGREIFYREAGDPASPTILLLHGLPGSSQEYANLIPALADQFHLVAPDYIGFGRSEAPPPGVFRYTFEAITDHVEALCEALKLETYQLYMHDCGGPVGFRLFGRDPTKVTAFIIQNANAYEAGVSAACSRAFTPLWAQRTGETEIAATAFMDQIAAAVGDRPGASREPLPAALVELLEDYRTNVELYPRWQAAFRTHTPPTLIIWGRHDPVFIPPGARAYLDDLPRAKLVWLDAGHAVLDRNWAQVAAEIRAAFLPRRPSAAAAQIARQRAANLQLNLAAS
jgi:pimeloyl-ACP methyl ester carboxylesterase